MMQGFSGFPPSQSGHTSVPNAFFSELLPLIDDVAELKLTMYCFWALQQREGDYRYVRRRDMLEDDLLLRALSTDHAAALSLLDQALERATARGTLLHVILGGAAGDDHLYFMNTARGRKAVAALEAGDWQPGTDDVPVALIVVRPPIFTLYEQNIGPLTPMMADYLRDAERTYQPEWIAQAMQIAVERNIRNWNYVEGILKRWQTKGKEDGPIRANAQKDRGTSHADYERFWDKD